MEYLRKEVIIAINRKTIDDNGGLFIPPTNFLHGEQLDYITDAVQSEMFGQELYPNLSDKAAVYMFNIISNHVFADGNKRTGLGAALTFLRLNDHRLTKQLLDENGNAYSSSRLKALENFTLAVASAQISLDQCRAWFAQNIVKG